MSERVNALSDAHRRVLRRLEALGLRVLEEVAFPPYTVDIYLPDFHACVEIDGPQHSAQADARRDAVLLEEYALPTFRIKAPIRRLTDQLVKLREFLKRARLTRAERAEQCERKTPWL